MSVQWNNDQLKAIEGRNGTMLVSAAAGSGKTAVLVERVIQRLCDEKNPCGIENLLIVTFTRAAAAQMKEKITSALQKKIAEEPGNKRLRKAVFMLPYANISTIDSFCINLVRDNYHVLGIAPDFRILDETMHEQMKSAAVMETVNEFHAERADEFVYLNNLINSLKNDDLVIEVIRRLHENSMAYTFPLRYLEGLRENYLMDLPIEETVWGKAAIDSAIKYLKETLALIDRSIEETSGDPECEPYYSRFRNDRATLERLLDVVFSHNWEAIASAVAALEFQSKPYKGTVPEQKDKYYHAVRSYSRGKTHVANKLSIFSYTREEHEHAMKVIAPAVVTLIDAVLTYREKLFALKKEANMYGFNDVLHFTLELLVEDDGNGNPVKTGLAEKISENYTEILVDEYQDVSKAQDTVFAALSRNDENRFMVGDVKQSIYTFRQAMPEVFTDLRKTMTDYDAVHYPARVDLSANYRSRKGITDTVNFIFSLIMTEYAGGVDYDSREALNPKAEYPESREPCAEFYLLEDTSAAAQAAQIAKYIKDAVQNGMQISEGEGFRNAKYSDFCILARQKKSFLLYSEAFIKAGIPLIIGSGRNLFDTPEVSFIISLLKVIDNPLNDVPLAAVMLSPVYGFTPDEVSKMRIKTRKGSIYKCLRRSADDGDEKARRFIDEISRLRRIAVNLPASEFVQRIIDESGYRAIVCAMSNRDARLAGINKFISVAQSYETTGVKGISAFVRYIDSVEKSGKGPEIKPSLTDSTDAVTMSTIHSSKGLEYPVVILCEAENTFSTQSIKSNLIVSGNAGLGMKYTEDGVIYETFARVSVKNEIKKKEHSEEIRLLYVALTRPKEKLVVFAASKDWVKKLETLSANAVKGGKPAEVAVLEMNSHADLIFTALLKHPDAHLLRELAGIDSSVYDECESRAVFELIKESAGGETADETPEAEYLPDPALLEELESRLSYVYPYDSLHGVAAKRVASDFEDEGFDITYFAAETPAFTGKAGLTPAQRGTATHRFMQYADYRNALRDTAGELSRLVAENKMTPEEGAAVDIESVHRFFTSSLAQRILAADDDKVFREYEFAVSLPLREVYPDIPEQAAKDEVVIIQGIADCAFVENGELVIVDYKTDRAASVSDLAVRYAPQLATYRRCLSLVFDMNVKETYIYSFRFGTQIEVK